MMKRINLFLMFFMIVGVLTLLGSASATTTNDTNKINQNIVSTTNSVPTITHVILPVSKVSAEKNSTIKTNSSSQDNEKYLSGTRKFSSINEGQGIWYVDPSLDNKYIQMIINGVDEGDTIFFESGVYTHISLTISKFCNLEGNNAILNGDGTSSILKILNGGSGTVTGFIINGTGLNNGITLNNTANVIIKNNTFSNDLNGICVINSTNITISNNTITKNIKGVVLAKNSTKNTIRSNIIVNCDNGVVIESSSNNSILENNLIRNSVSAITLLNSQSNVFVANTFNMNSNYGILFENSSDNIVKNGNYFNMTYEPFFITNTSSNNLISNNTILGCLDTPKFDSNIITILNGSNKNNIINNIIEFSNLRFIYIRNSDYTNIVGNTIGNPLNSTLTTTQIVGVDGIMINNTSHTTIKNNAIIGINGSNYTITNAGINLIFGNKNTVIIDNNINGALYGIKIELGNHNLTIKNNTIINAHKSAIYSATSLTMPNITGKSNKTANLTATLKDYEGNSISGEKINFSVNGKYVGSTVTAYTILSYILNLTKGTYNLTANYDGIQDYGSSTTTSYLIVKSPLNISNVDPGNNTVINSTNKPVTITFNDNIKEGNNKIFFYTNTGVPVNFTKTIKGNKLFLKPISNLKNGFKYFIKLNTGSITDTKGNPIELFKTTFKIDTTPLKIVSVIPENGGIISKTNKSIIFRFNKNITNGNNWIEFTSNKGTHVKFKETITNNTVTLTPITELNDSKYTITLHTGSIKDTAGNTITLFGTTLKIKP
ncbi:MAG: right-handed parallel beta-helix repeat-containing protein [Methanobacterium sp. ERen5]|nr:MAG: right-handed parallel beta-helix repeat-containing protein [Methanobacterium sp. ERen5]